MKRAKKTIPRVKELTVKQYEIQCPHCHTVVCGDIINDKIITFMCFFCKNPITIEWDKLIVEQSQ